jgi:dethiobiotin synthetase
VKLLRPPYVLARPVSPHLAAREAGIRIDLGVVERAIAPLRRDATLLVVELAGGLFTPLAEGAANVDLALRLAPDHVVLVAPDRLGVLHDVSAAIRASRAAGLPVSYVALSPSERPDPSTGTNGAELRAVTDCPVLALPHGPVEDLASSAAIDQLYAACVA